MALIVPPEVEQQINEWVGQPDYPDAQTVLSSAIRALAREREREMESLLESSGLGDAELAQLMKEAEESGPYREVTAKRGHVSVATASPSRRNGNWSVDAWPGSSNEMPRNAT